MTQSAAVSMINRLCVTLIRRMIAHIKKIFANYPQVTYFIMKFQLTLVQTSAAITRKTVVVYCNCLHFIAHR